MSSTLDRPLRHGILTKRSISKSRTTINAKFQERWFVLTDQTLTYLTPNGQTFRGKIEVSCIRVCEKVDRETFDRSQVFQIVYLDKGKPRALYLQGHNKADHDDWISSIRTVSEKVVGEKMLEHYHSGAYIKKKWSCCKKLTKYDEGCCNTYKADVFFSYSSKDRSHAPHSSQPPIPINPTKPMVHSQSAQHIKIRNTVKRKLSLQGLLKSSDADKSSVSSVSSSSGVGSVSSSIISSIEVMDSTEVFSEAELSEDDGELGISPCFRYKCSLDSSGNSPGL